MPNRVCRIVHSFYLEFLLARGRTAVASDAISGRRCGCFAQEVKSPGLTMAMMCRFWMMET